MKNNWKLLVGVTLIAAGAIGCCAQRLDSRPCRGGFEATVSR